MENIYQAPDDEPFEVHGQPPEPDSWSVFDAADPDFYQGQADGEPDRGVDFAVPDFVSDEVAECVRATNVDQEYTNVPVPGVEDVKAAYADVLKHNWSNTGYGAMITALAASMEAVEASTIDGALDTAKDAGDMGGELQGILSEDIMARIGIDIAPVGGYIIGDAGDKRATTAELVPILVSGEMFGEYVSTLSAEDLQDPEKLKLPRDVVHQLRAQIERGVKGGKTGDPEHDAQAKELVGDTLRKIVEIDTYFKQVGLDEPPAYTAMLAEPEPEYIDRAGKYWNYIGARKYLENYAELGNYVKYWNQGVLEEYVATGSMNELASSKIAYFDNAEHKVGEQTDSVLGLIGPPRTTAYGREAAAALLAGFEATLAELDTPGGAVMDAPENRALLTKNIARLHSVIG